ncbi:MAG: hypothetical protein OER96_08790 [Gammaproteobacteria bacterium]|nr:hypothetical protein [Gammaproteobacteria bacterium]
MQEEDTKPELDHVTRLGIMGEIAANLAHELNQPLSAISLYCDAALASVQSGQLPDPALVSLIESAREQAMRAGEIVRHMRQFIRSADRHGHPVQLNDLARQMMTYVESEANSKQVSIESSLDTQIPELKINRVQIAQVIGTLLHFSLLEFDDNNVTSRKIIVESKQVEDTVILSIRSEGCCNRNGNGSGVSDDDIQSGNRQITADVALSISRSIVEAHDGRLIRMSNQYDVVLPVDTN